MKPSSIPANRLGYSVAEVLDTGAFPTRNKIFDAIARGDIVSWKEGRSRVISAASLREYVSRKTREADGREQLPKRAKRQEQKQATTAGEGT
jgi:hypothetical protein